MWAAIKAIFPRISTAVVAVVVVVIVVVAGVAVYFLMWKGGGVEALVYPGATENAAASTELRSYLENYHISVEVKAYISTDKVATIAEWYRSKMAELGWSKENDLVGSTDTALLFKRGNDGALVSLENRSSQTNTTFWTLSGSWDTIALTFVSFLTRLSPSPLLENHVIIEGNAFSPSSITVKVNTIVIWINYGNVAHTVTSTSGPASFDLGTILPYVGASYQFTTPGTYTYKCSIHPEMTGTVTVTTG
jgi:plastocyanin